MDTRADERASASTIGIILLVAITVILGATIGGFMLDLRSDVESGGPDASFEFQYNSFTGDVKVTHESGDPVNGSQLRFAGAANEYTSFDSISGWAGGNVEAGDSVSVAVDEGETLELIWRNLEGDKSIVLNAYEVPTVGPAAEGDLGVTADLANDEVTVSVNSLADASNGQGYLKVDAGGSVIDTRTVSSTGDVTISSAGLSERQTVTATLYESSSESNQLAKATTNTPYAEITEIDATATSGSGTAEIVVTVEGENLGSDAAEVLIEDTSDFGDAADASAVASDLDSGPDTVRIQVNADNIGNGETLTVTVYETSARNYELDNETVNGGSTYTK